MCWPICSLYYEGIRHRGLCISRTSFYKYVHLLGLVRKWKKKKSKTTGFRAVAPNQFLHVDTTFWELDDGAKAAIVLVSDNFSRAILGWSVSLQHGAENVLMALKQAIATIQYYYPAHLSAAIVADGGSENHAFLIEALLANTKNPSLSKIIARKDIAFSNSPIEAINKIVKRYLRHYKPGSFSALQKVLSAVVTDYSDRRPHGSLNGLVPMQVYVNPSRILDFSNEKKRAKTLRIKENQQINCEVCSR